MLGQSTLPRDAAQQIDREAAGPTDLLSLSACIRSSDQPLVAAILRCDGPVCVIDSFLLRCLVIFRRVEHTRVARVLELALGTGYTEARDEVLPNARNGMVRECNSGLGFTVPDDARRWQALDFATVKVARPSAIARMEAQ